MTSTRKYYSIILAFLLCFAAMVGAQATTPSYTCSPTQACSIGCCSKTGVCGLGPEFCAAVNCTSSCSYKSECDPGWGIQWSNASTCPLKVCCSQYGFCGTTSEFCGSKTVTEPQCSSSGNSVNARTIGYYEGWNQERPCDTMAPADVPLGYYTHINFAFAYIDPVSYGIAPMSSDVAALYTQVSALKTSQPGLQVWISIGGWSFNDAGPTQSVFTDLAGSESLQLQFFASLISFLRTNNFDGVDLDWEYPVAPERSGRTQDFTDYPAFLKALRSALNVGGYGLSITIPSSYWYMRNFDIVNIEPSIDWFNIMTYDLHGTWDAGDPYIGDVALAHTNLTEIIQSLDLLWRNNINPSKVTMGLGFYGRSFTLDGGCSALSGCPFSGGGNPGPCTQTAGILSDVEIMNIIAQEHATVSLDPVAAVKIVTWGGNQWVSYDDAQTLKMKIQYANSKCLGGIMVWAIDLDNGTAIDSLGMGMNKTMKSSNSMGSMNVTDLGTIGSTTD